MKSDIKIALIGCGSIGRRHAKHILNFGMLSAVCDNDKTRADEFANTFGGKAYYNLEEMLEKESSVDVVSICTPNGLHAKHSILSLNAGKHVLCEKPMAINVDDCGEMIKSAEINNRRLFIIKQNRYNPPVAAVKALLDKRQLGTIFSVQLNCFWNRNVEYYSNSWRGTKELDGGTLFTQFSHFIDLLYWMIGDVKKVYALTENFAHKNVIEFEDTGVVALQFVNGAIGTINYTVNAYNKNMEGSITIFAEKGTVKIGGQYLNVLEYQSINGIEIECLPTGNSSNDYGSYMGSMSNHEKVYANLIDVLQNGAAITTNLFEGLKTVDIISRIYQSAKKLGT